MEGAIGRAAFLDADIQCRGHHHADVAVALQMGERCMDARPQMSGRHGGAHRELQLRHAFVQQVEDGRTLRDMAEPVAGDGDDEMRVVHCVVYRCSLLGRAAFYSG